MKTPLRVMLCLALSAAIAPGCIRRTVSSPDFGDGEARHALASEGWRVWQGGQLVGYLIRFDELGGGGQTLLSVRNHLNQDLGWIDGQGRAWRYRLHADPEWIGTGSLEMGTRLILGLEGSLRLEPADHQELLRELRDGVTRVGNQP